MKKTLLILSIVFCLKANAQTINYALNFNGSSDYVDLGSAASSNLRSIEFWFKPTANITSAITDPGYGLIMRHDATQLHEFAFLFPGTDWPSGRGYLQFGMRDNGTNHYVNSNSSSWTAGTWYHVCSTVDQTNGLKLYINGVQQTMTDPTCTISIPASPEITAVGTWGNAMIRYFPGKIDEVRFWNRALSQNEIQQKMCYWLNPANETGLVGYWKMNEGSGSTIFDATANANNGIINGATFVQDSNCFSGTLSIDQLVTQSNISIYPNPASDQFFIDANTTDKLNVDLYDVNGRHVFSKSVSGKTNIDLTTFNEGVYTLTIKMVDHLINKKLVIVR